MTCDTGLILGYILWPLIFPPPATRVEVTYRVWTGSVAWLGPSDCQIKTTCPVQISQRAGRCSLLTSLRAVPEIWTPGTGFPKKTSWRHLVSTWLHGPWRWLHYFPPLTTQFAQFLTLTKTNANNATEASKAAGRQKITSMGKLANFGNSSGFESIFELPCATNFKKALQKFSHSKPYSWNLT